jgi:hypothetical protein
MVRENTITADSQGSPKIGLCKGKPLFGHLLYNSKVTKDFSLDKEFKIKCWILRDFKISR